MQRHLWSCQKHAEQDSIASMLPRLTTKDWEEIQAAAGQALAKGHAALLDDQRTAHGDVRLANILARQREDHSWDIRFVDFGWSGIERQARYPVNINMRLSFPPDVWPRGLLKQEHDKQLLQAEIGRVIAELKQEHDKQLLQAEMGRVITELKSDVQAPVVRAGKKLKVSQE
eukprot:GHUV01020291.1.p2 GENE.GHUV01020291.1~~GHUV01020291.1.p2  ORF type:complete len:172 (+),score=42.04 GHUV01020291.1:291-806(+)